MPVINTLHPVINIFDKASNYIPEIELTDPLQRNNRRTIDFQNKLYLCIHCSSKTQRNIIDVITNWK